MRWRKCYGALDLAANCEIFCWELLLPVFVVESNILELPIHSIWIFKNTISVNDHLTDLLKCLFLTSALLSLSCRSFFELMLFFSKEEFVEKPLKDILSSFQVTTITFLLFFLSCLLLSQVIKMSQVFLASPYQTECDSYSYSALFAGVPLSASATQERLPAACEADHQSRRPVGASSAAGNPEGYRPAVKRGCAPQHVTQLMCHAHWGDSVKAVGEADSDYLSRQSHAAHWRTVR